VGNVEMDGGAVGLTVVDGGGGGWGEGLLLLWLVEKYSQRLLRERSLPPRGRSPGFF